MLNIAANTGLSAFSQLNPLQTLTALPAAAATQFTHAAQGFSTLLQSTHAISAGIWNSLEHAASAASGALIAPASLPSLTEFFQTPGMLCASLGIGLPATILSLGAVLIMGGMYTEHEVSATREKLTKHVAERFPNSEPARPSDAVKALRERYDDLHVMAIERSAPGLTEERLIDTMATINQKRDIATDLVAKNGTPRTDNGEWVMKWAHAERDYGLLLEKIQNSRTPLTPELFDEVDHVAKEWLDTAAFLDRFDNLESL